MPYRVEEVEAKLFVIIHQPSVVNHHDEAAHQ
jgi:hypothetical protein